MQLFSLAEEMNTPTPDEIVTLYREIAYWRGFILKQARIITIRKVLQNAVLTVLPSADHKKQEVANGQHVDGITRQKADTAQIPSGINSLRPSEVDSKDGMDGILATLSADTDRSTR